MKKVFLFFWIGLFSLNIFAQNPYELNSINASWSYVIPGQVIQEPQKTSYGFIITTDAKNLIALSNEGTLLWETYFHKFSEPLYSVLSHDFVCVASDKRTKIQLLNPSGGEIWNKKLDFQITQKPVSSPDGRFFVQGKNCVLCFGINGIIKWKIQTENQNDYRIQLLPDESFIVFLEKTENGKSTALRISKYGEILEEITFTGFVKNAYTTKEGILLLFSDGNIGLFSVDKKLSVNKWVHTKNPNCISNFVIVDSEKDDFMYIEKKSTDIQVFYINLKTGNPYKTYYLDSNPQINYCDSNENGFFLANDSTIHFYNHYGKELMCGKFSPQNSKDIYTLFTQNNHFIIFEKNWTINAFKTAQSVLKKNDFEKEINKNKFKITSDEYSHLFIDFENKDENEQKLLQLQNGFYGKQELIWEDEIFYTLDAYFDTKTQSNFGTRLPYSVFEINTTGFQSVLSQISYFGTSKYNAQIIKILKTEKNKSLLNTILKGISQNGYDPNLEILATLKNMIEKTPSMDSSIFIHSCDAIFSICNYMGRQAFYPMGKEILTSMLSSKYDSKTRDYARETLKKLTKIHL